MSIAKKKKFNEKMSLKKKFPNHQNLANGGVVVHKYADGGETTLGGPSAAMGSGGGVPNPNTGIAGTIGGALGLNNNYQAGAANVQQGTNQAQLNQAYGQVQGALTGQQALANTLTPQAAAAAANQEQLAGQFANQAAGGGPNVAGTQLNAATGQNVANQAALMAGQRGAGANVGLMARQAAMQGANTQQQAAGQAATLEQQQEIAAQQNLANLANNQISQTGQAITNASNAQMGEQGQLQGANTAYNNALTGMQSNINSVNAQTARGNQSAATNILGGFMGAGSSALSAMMSEGGEVHIHHHYAAGGGVQTDRPNLGAVNVPGVAGSGGPNVAGAAAEGPDTSTNLFDSASKATDKIMDAYDSREDAPAPAQNGQGGAGITKLFSMALMSRGGKMHPGPHGSHVANYLADGGPTKKVPALVSPKEVYLNPRQVKEVVERGADPMKIGHHFPGKDKVRGRDSKENDVLPTELEDGGVVLPLHITEHKDASNRGRKFVAKAIHMHAPKGRK